MGGTSSSPPSSQNRRSGGTTTAAAGNAPSTPPQQQSTTGRKRFSSATRMFFQGNNTPPTNATPPPLSTVPGTTQTQIPQNFVNSNKNAVNDDSVTGNEFRKISKDYTLEKQLGEGHYGVVRLGTNRKTKEKVAIKSILKKKVKRIEVLRREINVMRELKHPNIIKLLEVYEDETHLHLVMELCRGGELFERIISAGSLTELQAAQIMNQVLDALAYCHSKHIAHRDLKPENFLFATEAPDAPLKIIDFGLSNFFESEKDKFMKTRVGTPYYLAPEVLNRHFDEKCDLWSAGIIMYILLCGYPPFNGQSDQEIFAAIKRGRFSFPEEEWSGISMKAKELIKSLLQMDPKNRPSASEALKHPWFDAMLRSSTPPASQMKRKEPSDGGGPLPKTSSKQRLLPPSAIESLKKFAALSKLKRKAFGLISKQLSADDIQELGEHFQSIDQDNNKVITPTELIDAIGLHATSEEVKEIFAALDANGDGVINYEEFLNAASVRREYLKEERIKKAFEIFDKRGTGQVSVREFEEALGVQDDPKIVAEILSAVDSTEDGVIRLEDFKKMLDLGR